MVWALAILKGIGYGLMLGLLSFGPAFFALIKVGMQGGKTAGLKMALGIFISDFLVALACFFGLADLFTTQVFQLGFSAFAAFGIMFIGIKGVLVQYRHFIENIQKPMESNTNMIRGFVLNLLNPFVILLWVGILASISVGHNIESDDKYTILVQMLSILLTVFSLDLGKVYLSDYIGKKLNYRIYYFFNRYVGYILIAIGIYYLYHFVKLLIHWIS